MTTATQAQITTAKELWLRISCIEDRCVYEKDGCDCYEHILTALTAAAEAGKWKATAQENARLVLAERNAELVERLNSTIERCAQVIRDYNGSLMDSTRKNLIAAICALKEKP